jgi:hypothetical protein
MPYAPPVDLGEFYDEETLDYLYNLTASRPWAIHLIGPDEVHYNVNFEKDPDADDNPELTQRTALKTASELNAFVAAQPPHPGEDPPLMYHAVVLHHGEPWLPELNESAAVYTEWFDIEEYNWFCNQCFNQLDGKQACPTCAPTDIPGMQQADCYAEPRHPQTFVYADNGGYGAPCGWCAYDAMNEAHKDCEHNHCRAWRRWQATDRLLSLLFRLNVVKGLRWDDCNGRGRHASVIAWRWSR